MEETREPAVMADLVARMHRNLFAMYGDIAAMVAHAAPFDASVAPLIQRIIVRRRTGVERVCRQLVALGVMTQARFEDAAAHLELLTHEQTYEFLKNNGWSLDRYERWLRDEVLIVMLNH
jgi:hypothetical protein